jgi:hypothetical protein
MKVVTGSGLLEVVSEVDRGHAARAQLPREAVAVGEGGSEPREPLAHGRPTSMVQMSLWRSSLGK